MRRPVRALLLDDNVWCLRLLKGMLRECFPDLEIVARTEPDTTGDFDIYFVDNLFGIEPMAGALARRIRASKPDALVIAFSATLDAEMLKQLIDAGCSGVCDKTVYTDLPTTMEITQRYIESLTAKSQRECDTFMDALRSIHGLLREWNARLDRQSAQV